MADYYVVITTRVAITASNKEIANHRRDLLCKAALKGLGPFKASWMGDVEDFTAEVEEA